MSLKCELQSIDQEVLDASSAATFKLLRDMPPFMAVSAAAEEYPAFQGMVDATMDMSEAYGNETNPIAARAFRVGAFFTVLALRNYAEAEDARTTQSLGPEEPCLKDALQLLDRDTFKNAALATYEKADYCAEIAPLSDRKLARQALKRDYPQLQTFSLGAEKPARSFAEGNIARQIGFEDGIDFVLLSLRNCAEGEQLERQVTPSAS